MARWREHSAGGGWAWQAEKQLLALQNAAPSPPNAKAIALDGFRISVLAHERVAVLCSPTPRDAKRGSARLAARERREEKHARQRDGERNRSRVIFNARLRACLKIEGERFPSN